MASVTGQKPACWLNSRSLPEMPIISRVTTAVLEAQVELLRG